MDRGQPNNTRRMRRALRAPLLAALLLLVSATAAQAANTIVVNTTGGDPARNAANALQRDDGLLAAPGGRRGESSGDTIQLGVGFYSLTQGSDIDISKSLTIEGDGVADTTIDGSQNTDDNTVATARILRVDGASRHDREPDPDRRRRRGRTRTCANGCSTLQRERRRRAVQQAAEP